MQRQYAKAYNLNVLSHDCHWMHHKILQILEAFQLIEYSTLSLNFGPNDQVYKRVKMYIVFT